ALRGRRRRRAGAAEGRLRRAGQLGAAAHSAGPQGGDAMSARGQAVVETSLFMLVFITILVFAIHFAEIGWMTVKTQEPANSALWDATSRQMHDTSSANWDLYKQAITFAQGNANALYAGKRYTGVRTRQQQGIDTRCENTPNISLLATAPAAAAIPKRET